MIPITNITGRLGNQMFQFAFIINQLHLGLIKDCYLQDEANFIEAADKVKGLFRQGIPEKCDMVAIHVRRGDYVKHSFYVDLMETRYYERAMELFPHEKFVVFSDDIEWCKQQEIFKDCEFSHGTEVEDMNNMASCIGHIIANSSFSWWAAYLSPYTKKVVAPQDWHPDGVERTVCPANWIRL
jgi:Glycosyl transferase family 11